MTHADEARRIAPCDTCQGDPLGVRDSRQEWFGAQVRIVHFRVPCWTCLGGVKMSALQESIAAALAAAERAGIERAARSVAELGMKHHGTFSHPPYPADGVCREFFCEPYNGAVRAIRALLPAVPEPSGTPGELPAEPCDVCRGKGEIAAPCPPDCADGDQSYPCSIGHTQPCPSPTCKVPDPAEPAAKCSRGDKGCGETPCVCR